MDQTKTRKKLIEVALPLDAINAASAREKSIRHGHPSTLHLWWARRPLAAARAVLFAQLVDDPSDLPEEFPTEEEQKKERDRLFEIIEELVLWENTTNESVLEKARAEIRKSWRRTCADNRNHPRASELFDPEKLPAFHDPFAGGGAIPLEAQRLGLESYASDLNPVAVLINKAMIEIPPKFAGRPPVNPEHNAGQVGISAAWKGATGLAEDVRYYGKWMRDEAEKRIGHLYPKIEVTEEMAADRPDLKRYVGRKLTVVAWLWARTVRSPNPAFADVEVPLASTFILSKKAGKEAYIDPVIEEDGYRFDVKGLKPPDAAARGTTAGKRKAFYCLVSGVPVTYDYIRKEGQAGRMGARLMAIVAEGDRERVYLSPTREQEAIACDGTPVWKPDVDLAGKCRVNVSLYGLETFADLFTDRQLVALTTFSDLIREARERLRLDAAATGLQDDGVHLREGGIGATAYAEAASVYLAFAVDKRANYWTTICAWHQTRYGVVSTFSRQALPMMWDYAEANPIGNSSGNVLLGVNQAAKMLDALTTGSPGSISQCDAASQSGSVGKTVSTDPPYYDNIGYADLSDFFYVWLRRSLRQVFPELFATLAVPKSGELVATPFRHGGSKEKAEAFFIDGMTQAVRCLSEQTHPALPVTIYYAFKQSERKGDMNIASTGWETFLGAVQHAGFAISGTWPVRTEYTGNLKAKMNVLASSIVLACRARPTNASMATRREFADALKVELLKALRTMQAGNIAPVDLAQAAIGPGMAVFSRYTRVLDVNGQPLSVRDALSLINQTLEEALAEQEGDFDADTRWAVAWFEQAGFDQGDFGIAETLSKAKNTSVDGMSEAGILNAGGGKVRLLRPEELPDDWDPETDTRRTVWEMVHHLIRVHSQSGEAGAAELLAKLRADAESARELAYRLYRICEQKNRAQEALGYNALVQSWPEIARLARERPQAEQATLLSEAGGPQ
ncbi:MAG: DUF1156 domain-containing protein [Caldilineaceae bacterium]|nr:DUF1156 domain-containing protein [Caldilineaceae bacterium]